MKNPAIPCRRLPSGEPEVDQGIINSKLVTWNPDDARFYVHKDEVEVQATFKEWKNAVSYARRTS